MFAKRQRYRQPQETWCNIEDPIAPLAGPGGPYPEKANRREPKPKADEGRYEKISIPLAAAMI